MPADPETIDRLSGGFIGATIRVIVYLIPALATRPSSGWAIARIIQTAVSTILVGVGTAYLFTPSVRANVPFADRLEIAAIAGLLGAFTFDILPGLIELVRTNALRVAGSKLGGKPESKS